MAFSVSGVTERISELLSQAPELLNGVKDEVDQMIGGLRLTKSFLIDIDSRRGEPALRNLVAEIRDVAEEAEDVVDTFVLKTSLRRGRGISNAVKRSACILEEGWIIHKTKSKIKKITNKITDLTRQLEQNGIKQSSDAEGLSSSRDQRRRLKRYYHHIGGSNIVGLDRKIKELVSVLVGDSRRNCQVVSICGMGGSGKTTLAKNVCNHSRVRDHFVGHAWVFVSKQWQRRKIWEDVLYSLGSFDEAGSKQSDEELAGKLFKFLKDNKCLVILDGIWCVEAWDGIKAAFPSKSETGSKILLTTRSDELPLYADPGGHVHQMMMLTEDQSLELFSKIASSERDLQEQLSRKGSLGMEIVNCCAGLPLAIVVMGGILATKCSAEEWEMVLNHVKSNLSREDVYLNVLDVLALAYDDFPYYLKPCFLYLSHFPEGYEISASKLIQLWVTEGIVPSMQHDDNEGEVIEDVAKSCLMELVERCMIQVGEREANFKIRTCYMHDIMRKMCLSKAMQESFISIIKKRQDSSRDDEFFRPRVPRLAIHEYLPIQHFRNPHLRSLLFFNEIYPDELISSSLRRSTEIFLREDKAWISMLWQLLKFMQKFRTILRYLFNNFKLLRVLDFEGADIYLEGEFLIDIAKLFRLRYLSLKSTTCVSKIPSSLGNLKWLQTLDLRTNEEFPIGIPDVICKMERLIHLYLPMVCDSKTKLRLNTLRNLRTLVNFNSKNCYVRDLHSMTNLRVLTISTHFCVEDFAENSGLNPVIASNHLRSLSILHPEKIDPRHLTHLLSSCNRISELSLTVAIGAYPPASLRFPDQITSMFLTETELSSDPMPVLEKLPKLMFLELQKAFTGKGLHCSRRGFPELDSLKLIANSNVEKWRVDKQPCMPKLRHLEIIDCKRLMMLPDELMSITTLEELKIELMPKTFKDRLVEGGGDFNKVKHVSSVIFQNCY